MSKVNFDIISKYNDAGVSKAEKSLKGLSSTADKQGKEGGKNYAVGFSKGIEPLGGRVSGFMRTSLGKAAALGAGALAGGSFVMAFQDALSQGQDQAKLQAQLGLSDKAAAKAAKISGKLYAQNFGENVGAVNDTIRKVIQDTEVGINSLNLKPITAKIVTVTETFEQETGQVTRAVGQLVRTGLAKNVGQATDLITKGFQKGADKSEDFLDTLNEYGTLFRNMGLSGAQATGILVQGLEAGARDADKVADAIKEFSIRAVDGSDLTRQAFKKLGFDAQDITQKIAKGGKSASLGLNSTLMALRDIQDPVKRTRVAVALFGTQAEDLGDALYAIDPSEATRRLGKFRGAAKDAVDTVGGTAQAKVNSFIRTLKQGLVEGLGAAIKSFESGVIEGKGFVRFMSEAGVVIRDVTDAVRAIAEKFLGLPGPVKSAALSIGAFLLIRNQFPGFGAAISRNIIAPFRDAPSAVGGFKGALANTGKMMLRGGLWGIAIGVAGAALTGLFGKFFEAKQRVDQLTDALKADAGAIRATTKAAIANMLIEDGMGDAARNAAVSFELVTRASLGQIDAQRELELKAQALKSRLDELHKIQAFKLTPAQNEEIAVLSKQKAALEKVIGKTQGLDKSLQKSKDNFDDFRAAQVAVNGALGKGSSALDKNTKQGQKNIDKLKRLAQGAIEHAKSMDRDGKAHDIVTGKMEKARQKFIATAIKMGASREEARKLADKLRLIPGKYKAIIEANTKPAERAISRFIETQDGRKINLNVGGFGSGNPGVATGGAIHGPGTGTSDTAGLFRLSNGEHVWTAKEVERAGGHGAIERMRSLAKSGSLQKIFNGMAAGGPVTLDVRSTGLDSLREKITQALSVPAVSGVPSSVGGNAAIVKSIFSQMFGWARYWPQTYSLLMKESGFRNTAQNPTSTAYGMFQFLDSTWGGYGIPKTSDPRLQTIAGGRYIAGRYGNPANALAFHLRNNWYDKGGMLQSGRTAVNKSGKPERVLSPRQTNAFERLVDNLLGGVKQSDDPLRRLLRVLNRTMRRLSGLLRKADKDWFAGRAMQVRERLTGLLKRRERIDNRLERAISLRDKRVSQRRDVAGGLRSGILEQRNLVGGFGIDIDGGFSAGDIAGQLEANLAKTRRFQRLLRRLRRKGFRANVIGQIAQAGPEEGFDTASALADADKSQVRSINQSFVGIFKAAKGFSKEIGRKLYGSGIQAARGLVQGLRDRRKQIQRTMNDIARSLVKALKNALEMRSPSKVLQRLGVQGGDSFIGGFQIPMSGKSKAARQMLRHLNKGGGFFEDFSFRGMSGLADRHNERLARKFHSSGREFNRQNVRQFLRNQSGRGGDVHIHLHIDKPVTDARQLVHQLRQIIRNNQTVRRELGLA